MVPAHAESWSVSNPFSGELKEENGTTFIYGRGAIDDKGTLMGIFEALEFRLSRGKNKIVVAKRHGTIPLLLAGQKTNTDEDKI